VPGVKRLFHQMPSRAAGAAEDEKLHRGRILARLSRYHSAP
jgi:hypothetical protein